MLSLRSKSGAKPQTEPHATEYGVAPGAIYTHTIPMVCLRRVRAHHLTDHTDGQIRLLSRPYPPTAQTIPRRASSSPASSTGVLAARPQTPPQPTNHFSLRETPISPRSSGTWFGRLCPRSLCSLGGCGFALRHRRRLTTLRVCGRPDSRRGQTANMSH